MGRHEFEFERPAVLSSRKRLVLPAVGELANGLEEELERQFVIMRPVQRLALAHVGDTHRSQLDRG